MRPAVAHNHGNIFLGRAENFFESDAQAVVTRTKPLIGMSSSGGKVCTLLLAYFFTSTKARIAGRCRSLLERNSSGASRGGSIGERGATGIADYAPQLLPIYRFRGLPGFHQIAQGLLIDHREHNFSNDAVDPVTDISYTVYYDAFTVGAGYLDIMAALSNTTLETGPAISPYVTFNQTTGGQQCDLGLQRDLGQQRHLGQQCDLGQQCAVLINGEQ